MGAIISVPVDDPLQMAWLDTNDLGNAERLVRLARGLLLWVEDLGWVGFDLRRWSTRHGQRMAERLAHDVARHIDREAASLNEIAEDARELEGAFGWAVPVEVAKERVVVLRKHAVKSGNTSATNGMLAQARSLLSAERETFDVDPLAINMANGTLRFKKEEGGGWGVRFAPHDPVDRFMQIARVTYEPDIACPEWTARMELIQPERDQRRMLQTLYGYVLTGLTSEQKWFIFQGRGGDGKSLTNSVVARLLGDYHRHADIATFLDQGKKSGSDHSSDMARLRGDIRLVTCEEPTRSSTWNGTRLKQVTGGVVTARPLREVEIEFEPRWKLIIEVNPLPAVQSDDDGFWRRCWPIPFGYQFDKGGVASEPFEQLRDRFVEQEGSGILNWMIAGALKWLSTRRLQQSEAANAFALAYRQSASPIGEWYMERCDTTDPEALTASGVLWGDFEAWAVAAGIEKPGTRTAFGRWLRDKQHLEKKDRLGKRLRRGVKLRIDAAPLPVATPSEQKNGGGGRGSPQATELDDDFEPGWPA